MTKHLNEVRKQLEVARVQAGVFEVGIARIHPECTGPMQFLELQKMAIALAEANRSLIEQYLAMIDLYEAAVKDESGYR